MTAAASDRAAKFWAVVRVASGSLVLDTSVTWAANATLQAVATAVAALGNGWSARVVGSATGDYGLWPSQDLYVAPSRMLRSGAACIWSMRRGYT